MITIKKLIEIHEIKADINDPQIFLHLTSSVPFRVGTELKSPAMVAKIIKIEWMPERNSFKIIINNGQSIGLSQLIKAIKNNQITII